jgi:hypothetical protein
MGFEMDVRNQRASAQESIGKKAFSVTEFCDEHGISRALFYLLQARGSGPRIMKVGRRTLVSVEAAREWRRAMEADAAVDVQGLNGSRPVVSTNFLEHTPAGVA